MLRLGTTEKSSDFASQNFISNALKPINPSIETTHWSSVLEAARSGDEHATSQLWTQLRGYLLLLADRGLGDALKQKIDASDIVQQSLIEAQRDLIHFGGNSEGELRVWLKRLVNHNLIDASRQFRETERRDVSREISIDGAANQIAGLDKTASSILLRSEHDEQLIEAISKLSDRKRQIVEMRHRDRLSYFEISQRMNMTEVAVRKSWSRAIEDMRNLLASHYAE